jgi:hypothetical protein
LQSLDVREVWATGCFPESYYCICKLRPGTISFVSFVPRLRAGLMHFGWLSVFDEYSEYQRRSLLVIVCLRHLIVSSCFAVACFLCVPFVGEISLFQTLLTAKKDILVGYFTGRFFLSIVYWLMHLVSG